LIRFRAFRDKILKFTSEGKPSEMAENAVNKIFNGFTISLLILGAVTYFIIHKLDQRAFFEGKFGLDKLENLLALRKPAFTNYNEREFYLPDIFIPVIIKERPNIIRVYLDIKLRVSNKLIKIFFTENNFVNADLLVDRLLISLAPIITTFPLTDEGKKVLKDKIKFECNQLLKELKIKGEVEEVFIQDISAA
jgi:flagellar basal body-associated protein FliL